jgi:hypothetical protein
LSTPNNEKESEVENKNKIKDYKAVENTALAYIDAAYCEDPSKIENNVHPNLAKMGFCMEDNGYAEYPMTYPELVEVVKTFNEDGHVPEDAFKKVTIFEVLDQTVSVKLETVFGIEYIHLAKYEGKWLIIQVLWQTAAKNIS